MGTLLETRRRDASLRPVAALRWLDAMPPFQETTAAMCRVFIVAKGK
jgi:hypothetical protein